MIGEAPNWLLLRHEVTTHLLLLIPPQLKRQDRSHWVESRFEHFQEAHENVLNHYYYRAQQTQKFYHDRRLRGYEFIEGDYELYLASRQKDEVT